MDYVAAVIDEIALEGLDGNDTFTYTLNPYLVVYGLTKSRPHSVDRYNPRITTAQIPGTPYTY